MAQPHQGGMIRRPSSLWIVLVAVLAAATIVNFATPQITAAALRGALSRTLGSSEITVRVAAWPPVAVWWGQVDTVAVEARDLHAGALTVDAFDATLEQVRLDPTALYADHKLAIRSLGSCVARIRVSQSTLTAVVAAQASLHDVSVVLTRGRVSLAATVSMLGTPLRATADGRLVLDGPTAVDLVLDRVNVSGIALPPGVANAATRSFNPVLDVRSLPFNLHFTGLTVADGWVTIDMAGGAN
jgi:LmeA-like phospholipid-binding